MIGRQKEWINVTLGDLGEYINGMAFKPSDWDGAGRPIVRIQNLTNPTRELNRTSRRVEPKYIVSNGDILVSWSATLDAYIWRREEAVLNQHIFKVVPNENVVDRNYLYYQLKNSISDLINGEHLHGSTMKHINRGPFLSHGVKLPPLAEQRRMAAKIDGLSARSGRARAHLDHIPRLVEKYKQAVLAATFAEESTSDWKSTDFGDVVSDALIGLVRNKSEQSPDDGIPYVRMNHFEADATWNFDDLTRVKATKAEVGRFKLNEGDILFNTRNSYELVGKVALWKARNEDYVFNNNIMRIRLIGDVYPTFALLQMMATPFRGHLQGEKSATTSVCAIYQRSLMAAPFRYPKKERQRTIANRIESAFAWIDRLASEASSARKLVDRLDQAVLAKAFRGELVPQDPNDEPASALLERIRAERCTAPKTGRRGRPRKAS